MSLISKSKSKFNVDTSQKGKLNRTYDGTIYASEMEMQYYKEVVKVGLENGSIIKCDRQVKYELQPEFYNKGIKYNPINYVSDFNIYYANGEQEVIDVKGLAKSLDIIHRKLLLYKYPDINFKWMTKSIIDGGWVTYEVVKKGRAKRKKNKHIKGDIK